MALSKRLQLIELLRRPPANVPTELQAAFTALATAYAGCSKAKRKRWREDVRDEHIASLPAKWHAAITAAENADIADDGEVN